MAMPTRRSDGSPLPSRPLPSPSTSRQSSKDSLEVHLKFPDPADARKAKVRLEVRLWQQASGKSGRLAVASSVVQPHLDGTNVFLGDHGGRVLSRKQSLKEVERGMAAQLERSSSQRSSPANTPPLGRAGDGFREGDPSNTSPLGNASADGGPTQSDIERYVGTWKAAGVEGREAFLKAMELPWILRKLVAVRSR